VTDYSRLIVPPLDADPWPTLGPEVFDYIEDNLCYGPGDLLGSPVTLSNEIRLFIYRAYELFPRGHENERGQDIGGRRRFKRVALSRRKGLGKTEIAAWLAIAELDPDAPVRCDGWRLVDGAYVPVGRGVLDAYVPMVAYTEEQTEELAYYAAYSILERCAYGDKFDLTLERIGLRDAPGKITALAAAPDSRDGARTTFQHFDETHRFVTDRLNKAVRTMRRNIPKRIAADAWSLETTTMYGPGEGSVAEDSHVYAEAIARGEIKDPRLYFDHRQGREKWDISKDDELREALKEASGDGWAWTDADAVVAMFREPDADENENRRYWLNQRRRATNRWPVAYLWAERRADRVIEPGTQIVLGFDGSYNRDSTQLVGCTVEEIPHIFHIRSWERPHDVKDWRVPVLNVLAAVDDAMETYEVLEFAPDPPGWFAQVEEWEEKYGAVVVRFETNQPRRFGPACDDFEQGVRDKTLTHDGSEVIARHINNAITEVRGRQLVITKDRPDDPEIDAADAAVVALHRARWHFAHADDGFGAMAIDLSDLQPDEDPDEGE
jgi:phage terminase large subunit-like protein